MKKRAFTLAEVVIVLAIVSILGLVAIKTLTSNEVEDKAQAQAAKAVYLQVDKATRSIIANNTNNYTLERMKDSSGEFSVASSTSLARMVQLYKENMVAKRNATQDATYLATDLSNDATTLTGITPSYFSGFTLRNDSYFGLFLNDNCTTTINYIYDPLMPDKRTITNTCGIIFYDVNGDKKPNVLGVDQFILALGKLGLK